MYGHLLVQLTPQDECFDLLFVLHTFKPRFSERIGLVFYLYRVVCGDAVLILYKINVWIIFCEVIGFVDCLDKGFVCMRRVLKCAFAYDQSLTVRRWVTLCGWQDIKIQLLISCILFEPWSANGQSLNMCNSNLSLERNWHEPRSQEMGK